MGGIRFWGYGYPVNLFPVSPYNMYLINSGFRYLLGFAPQYFPSRYYLTSKNHTRLTECGHERIPN